MSRNPNEAYLAALGRFTEEWGKAEFLLDVFVTAFHFKFDHARFEKNLPVPLSAKIEYLRRAFKRHGLNEARLESVNTLLDAVKQCGNARHDAIHGLAYGTNLEDGSRHSMRLVYEKGGFVQKKQMITVDMLNEVAAQFVSLQKALFTLCADIDPDLVPPELRSTQPFQQ